MPDIPGHTLPTYSEEACDDALFHYTTGSGLLGIVLNNELWSTAYYCANDESELKAGKGVLTPTFRNKTHELIQSGDRRVEIFRNRGVDILDYADNFEQHLFSFALNFFCVYITCFCRALSKEDFQHGLLSQWRGYGLDGGYAIQFSRKRLRENMTEANKSVGVNYELEDVFYEPANRFKEDVDKHSDAYVGAYLSHLDMLVEAKFDKPIRNPIADLTGGPLESLLDYLIHTKSPHFTEEREARLSVLEPVRTDGAKLGVEFLNRDGLIVPYVKAPAEFDVLSCIDWIIVGPSPRIEARFASTLQLVRNRGLDIKVRPSHIPFSRS